jgi:hypothetical protein
LKTSLNKSLSLKKIICEADNILNCAIERIILDLKKAIIDEGSKKKLANMERWS